MSKAQSRPKMGPGWRQRRRGCFLAVSWAQAVETVRVATLGPSGFVCRVQGREGPGCERLLTPGAICERRLLANLCSTLSPKRS